MQGEYLILVSVIFLSVYLSHKIFKWTVWPDKKVLLPTLFIPAAVFVFLDILVTGFFWDFNPQYVFDWRFFNLPLEEVSFFFIVPLACLFLWANIQKFIADKEFAVRKTGERLIVSIFGVLAILFFLQNFWYSAGICFLMFLVLVWAQKEGINLLFGRRQVLFLVLVLLLTTIFNGYLTWRPIVVYNPEIKTNLNIFTIPIEDYVYGLALVFFNLTLYGKLLKRKLTNF